MSTQCYPVISYIRFSDPKQSTCGKKLRVSAGAAGKSVRCPGCQSRVGTVREVAAVAGATAGVGAALTATVRAPYRNAGRVEGRPVPRASRGVLVGAGLAATLLVVLVLAWLWSSSRRSNGREPTGRVVVPTLRSDPNQTALQPKEASPPTTSKLPPLPTTPEMVKPQKTSPVAPKRDDPVAGKDFANSIGMQMKWIAGGTFQMGSDKAMDSDALDSEVSRHSVTIARPFFLASCLTTQAQFEQILHRQSSRFSASGGGKDKVNGIDTGRFPVETISYFDAVEFCNKLSEKENRRPCYRLTGIQRHEEGSIKMAEVESFNGGTGYRLPSEAEWEYCARAGTGTRYWFGDVAGQLGEHAWFSGNSDGRMHPVGEKKANPWGLYDMGGLAFAWCDDVWHDNYQGAPVDGSAWRSGGDQTRRVVRGGSWSYNARLCRCADRFWFGASSRDYGLGVRVVLVSP